MVKTRIHSSTVNYPDIKDSLSQLKVFDKLEVGPIQLDAKRLIAPYRLLINGEEKTTPLIYSYEEKVFDPSETESQNLAALIAAQAALNYGLFCQQIVFNGVFDDTDRRFLTDMLENTAREIYAKKILEPNPFLTQDLSDFPLVKKKKYTDGDLFFPDSDAEKTKLKWRFWETHPHRHCILSSGGKDSLLSFGLLNEISRDTHPIFVNESGRHWFTALNAYRHFNRHVPNTGRVWTNCDRLFTWMLRQMPFIRKDFAKMRSDMYPIRLWTVAVFLFGVLPIMRKRGIGRLIIGDEYDTTVQKSHKGLKHYDGLYDQSIYFDRALTRYFYRKGWAISQFSILRPLSELLIEKVLCERYPDIQKHQMSCHAAHKGQGKILPCGKCEKCRRIIAMLSAIGADPTQCGYTPSQIDRFFQMPNLRDFHQEIPAMEHLTSMLTGKGLLGQETATVSDMEHPEIMKLRFHPKISPITSIPTDLRAPIYNILIRYAAGTVRRAGATWEDFHLFSDPEMSKPYVFEIGSTNTMAPYQRENDFFDKSNHIWGELTSPEVKERIQKTDVALLPVGSIEQHGPHLPVDTDAYDAGYLALRVAEACGNPKPLVLPLIPYGVSYHHDDFPGTLSLSNETLSRVVHEVGMAAAANGIKKLIIINGHGGNSPALNQAAQTISRDARIFVCVDSGETSDTDIDALIETPNDVHAGEAETSTSLAIRPHLVKMNAAISSIPKFSSRYLNFSSKHSVSWYGHTREISAVGIMGNPLKASAEKGVKIWEIMIAHLVALVEDIKPMTLDEIHNRRL